MKTIVMGVLFSLAFMGMGCLEQEIKEPEIIIEPPTEVLVSQDTIREGDHLGIVVGSTTENAYSVLRQLPTPKPMEYVNVVGGVATNLSQVTNRIPLYQSIFLDEQTGTDSGIQIAFEAGQVKSIFLNSGKSLDQRPVKENASMSVRIGDKVEELHAKLVKIESKNSYTNKFERISLFTKNLATSYDPTMTNSPQWYFRYEVEPNLYEHVQVYIEQGKVKFIEVSRYKILL